MMGVLVLAAGRSTRFGSDKRRLVLPNRQLMVDHTVSIYRQLTTSCVVVVDDIEWQSHFSSQRVHSIVCDDAQQGMARSLVCGVKEAHRQKWSACLIALADMPFLQVDSVREVLAAMQKHAIVVPMYNQRRGHPVGFHSSYFEELMALSGDQGARSIINHHSDDCCFLELNDQGILLDIDSSEDWLGLRAHFPTNS